MFHDILKVIEDRMRYLEAIDKRDRTDGTPRMKRMRQITQDTGRFIDIMLASAPEGACIEIGTSAGYSSLWLALACREAGRKLVTFEFLDEKAELARETFRLTGVEDVVELVKGDALELLPSYKNIAFCFLDAEKEIYDACYELVLPNMMRGGILVADNFLEPADHRETLCPMLEKVLADTRVDAVLVPVGNGELLCRKR